MSSILAALALLATLTPGVEQMPGAGGERLLRGRVELVGPLEGATLTLGRSGSTELTAHLLAGESRRVVLPFPGRPLDGEPPVITSRPESGRVTFLGWEGPAEWTPAFSRLSRRTRPPVGDSALRAGWPALALVGAAAFLVLSARRRPRVALGLGLAAALVVALAERAGPDPTPSRVRVLESDGRDWLLVEGAAASLACPSTSTLSLECAPTGAPLVWGVEVKRDGVNWEARSPGGRLWRLGRLDPGGRHLSGAANTWGTLEQVFTRSTSGTWTDRGAWTLGDPLPQPVPTHGVGPAPPGWLASGLPQGREVLVGRLASGTWAGGASAGGESNPQSVWVRLVGFETSESH